MQAYFRSRQVRQACRDWILGLGLFMVLAVGLSGDPHTWSLSRAAASDWTVAQAIGVTSPPGLRAGNALFIRHGHIERQQPGCGGIDGH